MFWTRRNRIALAAAACVGAVPTIAAASWHSGNHGGWQGWGHARHARHQQDWCGGDGARLGQAMAFVEAHLALKPEQQDAWARLAEAVETAGRNLKVACESVRADVRGEFRRLEAGLEAGLAAVRAIRPHIEALHAALEPDQRARLDRLLTGSL